MVIIKLTGHLLGWGDGGHDGHDVHPKLGFLTLSGQPFWKGGHNGHPNNLLAIQHLGLHLLWDLDWISPAVPERLLIFMILFPMSPASSSISPASSSQISASSSSKEEKEEKTFLRQSQAWLQWWPAQQRHNWRFLIESVEILVAFPYWCFFGIYLKQHNWGF